MYYLECGYIQSCHYHHGFRSSSQPPTFQWNKTGTGGGGGGRCRKCEWGSRNVAQDLGHRKHPVQCLEMACKRVASEQESPIHLREPFFVLYACMECN